MPISASELEAEDFLRVLLMGIAKSGKTTSSIISLVEAFGWGYVLACSDKSHLQPAKRRTDKFKFDLVRVENDMEAALKEARRGVKAGEYKWLLLDDVSLFASRLENKFREEAAAKTRSGEANSMMWSREFKSRILNYVSRLFDLSAHIVITSHYIEQGGEIADPKTGARQRAKSGPGIMPLIYGAAREELPAMCHDVLFLEKITVRVKRAGEPKPVWVSKRVFQVNPDGVWGLGSQSTDGTKAIKASFKDFWELSHPPAPAAAGSLHAISSAS